MTVLVETEKRLNQNLSASYIEDGKKLALLSPDDEIIESVPVYNVRNPDHHEDIAKAIASGDTGAFDVGIIGLLIAVEDPRGEKLLERERRRLEQIDSTRELMPNSKKFWRVKDGRPAEAKVPFMSTPEEIHKFVDFNKLHPNFRHLRNQSAREQLYSYPIHIIWPVRNNKKIDQDSFVTTSEDSKKKPPDQHVEFDTVCIFVPGSDPDWLHVGYRATSYNPHALLGVTSFNAHGELPPFNDEELAIYMIKRYETEGELDFDFFVNDPIAKKSRVRSSHTQARLPLVGEEPTIKIVRRGPVGARDMENYTGYRVVDLVSAGLSSRAADEDADLFPSLHSWMREAAASRRQR